jgi:Fusaric acid resistance protein-like
VELFNASGAARRLRASPLLAIGPSEPGPALRRGALVAVPVGVALLLELGLNSASKGAIGTGALLAGFPGLDAPARTRAAWQAAVAPLVGLAAALGVLTGSNAFLAVASMAILGAAAGYCFAVSLRLSIAGLSVALSLLIAQGLPLDAADALPALLLTTAGGLLQAGFSLTVWMAGDRAEERGEVAWNTATALDALQANLTLSSIDLRHALRFGAALGAGVGAYWLLGMSEHGFWIPLTILFVLRPERDETFHRLALRAIGTAAGLLVATALAEWLGGDGVGDRRRPHCRHRFLLRLAHRPVRALHCGDHYLCGSARRLDRRGRAARRRTARAGDRDRDRDRRRGISTLAQLPRGPKGPD